MIQPKKAIYLFLTIVLGIILSFTLHGLIEIFYINYSFSKGTVLNPSSLTPKCFLPTQFQIFLLLASLIGGYLLDRKWWQEVCPEKKLKK